MTEIKLRLDKWLEGEEIADGVIVNLFPIGQAGPTTRKSHRGITIPAGYGTAFRTIAADSGRYLIEARFPPGETLSQEVEVPPPGSVPLERTKASRCGSRTSGSTAIITCAANVWRALARYRASASRQR